MAAGTEAGGGGGGGGVPQIVAGAVVSCRTTFGDEFKGEVIAYDENSKALIIKSPTSAKSSAPRTSKSSVFDVSVINLNVVPEGGFQLLAAAPRGASSAPLPDIDRQKINRRLQNAKERIGIGVSNVGQDLFDVIQKTLPECRWRDQDIVIMDEVTISPPYTAENCSANSSRATVNFKYIKTIIQNFHVTRTQQNSTGTTLHE